MGKISGLDKFGLTKGDLPRLRNRHARIRIYFSGCRVTRDVLSLSPKLRSDYLDLKSGRQMLAFRKLFPKLSPRLSDPKGPLQHSSLIVRVSLSDAQRIANAPMVQSVGVVAIEGLRRRTRFVPLSWYCVRALVAIQVEGQTKGRQAIEDRFVVVKARSMSDAEKRLKKHWQEYGDPYLNSDGLAARWNFEKVIDVYEMVPTEIDSAGTEVYSSLSARKFKSNDVWRPRKRSGRPKR